MTQAHAADLIEAAAELLEHDGWMQGDQWPGAGRRESYRAGMPLCLMGSLGVAETHMSERVLTAEDNLMFAVTQYLACILQREHGLGSLVQWNDARDRTAGEVIDFLKYAAKEIRNNVMPDPRSTFNLRAVIGY